MCRRVMLPHCKNCRHWGDCNGTDAMCDPGNIARICPLGYEPQGPDAKLSPDSHGMSGLQSSDSWREARGFLRVDDD